CRPRPPAAHPVSLRPPSATPGRFVDFETGSFYLEKPEHMTHLHGNVLVPKNHPRIVFRGKLDSLQAQIVLAQAILAETAPKESPRLIEDLGGIL
ncbi:MAG: ATP-binding protein, partial [Clostridiales bacterium]|nr:ATP-binding protein [Clostridiales bacterium]